MVNSQRNMVLNPKDGNIQFTAFPDALKLFGGLENIVSWDNVPLQFVALDFFIHCHVAGLVLFAAAAPAGVVSSQFFHNMSSPFP